MCTWQGTEVYMAVKRCADCPHTQHDCKRVNSLILRAMPGTAAALLESGLADLPGGFRAEEGAKGALVTGGVRHVLDPDLTGHDAPRDSRPELGFRDHLADQQVVGGRVRAFPDVHAGHG